jgi:hypothetical protein
MLQPGNLELDACTPDPLTPDGFNDHARLPYDCTLDHIRSAMQEFLNFLGFINMQLHTKDIARLESMLIPAGFSSLVGEFFVSTLPRFSAGLAKNNYHNGHPDLVSAGMYPDNASQYGHLGIEVKASRYERGWQGHNAEESWLLILVYTASRPSDKHKNVRPVPFRYDAVYGAQLERRDWTFSGRSSESRRTITASVNPTGYEKMVANWIYRRTTVLQDAEQVPLTDTAAADAENG